MRLMSTVQELRLEISYYQGEVKRVEWEKDCLKQELNSTSSLFKSWIQDVKNTRSQRIFDDPNLIALMADFPTRPISQVLEYNHDPVLLTTCQEPFFIEYANAAWVNVCGWDTHDICGLPCKFLQGELTDKKISAIFMEDIKEVGYARMRILNYRKNGSAYSATVTVFPVYDSVSPDGPGCDTAFLTHFSASLSSITDVEVSNSVVAGASASVKDEDRRASCLQYSAVCHISAANFIKFCSTVRLSDLLRFALTCSNAVLITDASGRILHINNGWYDVYMFTLVEVEMKDPFTVVTGREFDSETLKRLFIPTDPTQCTQGHMNRNGESFSSTVTVVPIKGGLRSSEVSHYCLLFVPTDGADTSELSSPDPTGIQHHGGLPLSSSC